MNLATCGDAGRQAPPSAAPAGARKRQRLQRAETAGPVRLEPQAWGTPLYRAGQRAHPSGYPTGTRSSPSNSALGMDRRDGTLHLEWTLRPFVNVDGCDPHRWWSLGTGVVVDGGTGRWSKRRDDERADEHQALPRTTGAANASVSERRGCRNACGAGRRRYACGPNEPPNFLRNQCVAFNVSALGTGETPYIASRCAVGSPSARFRRGQSCRQSIFWTQWPTVDTQSV